MARPIRRTTPGVAVSEWQTMGLLDEVSHKWRRLAERRHEHFVELFHSGRWKHYYAEERFLDFMREAVRLAERWSVIAPPSAEGARTEAVMPAEAGTRRDAA
jgi:uncharacterized repeat protein (TIGR03809 family)